MQLESRITFCRGLGIILVFVLLFILTHREFLYPLLVKYVREKYPNRDIQQSPIKYILHWTDYYLVFENGKHIFPSLDCPVKNCYFTKDRRMFGGDYSKFHVIMFDDRFLKLDGKYKNNIPEYRSAEQIFVYTSIESPILRPACELHSDNLFNWTFTFRFDSTITWFYFAVHNRSGHVIAPSKTVVWDQSPTSELSNDIKNILRGKNKTAMWLVSNCQAHSLRDDYLTDLQEHLYHYQLHIDVFGLCSRNTCGDKCEELIKNKYYFYMAFENSISEDYVSEKVLHGYNNYAIPIVFGGANYSRFLPPNSYIDANQYNPYILATKMREIIDNPKLYESYFLWTNLYKIRGMTSGRTLMRSPYHPLCDFCAKLNDPSSLKKTPAIENFRMWWNHGPAGMKWCLPPALSNDEQGGIYILPSSEKLDESTMDD